MNTNQTVETRSKNAGSRGNLERQVFDAEYEATKVIAEKEAPRSRAALAVSPTIAVMGASKDVGSVSSTAQGQVKPSDIIRETVLGQWEGTVQEVREGEISAELVDLLEPRVPERAEISTDEITPIEGQPIVAGSQFYMTIVRQVLKTKEIRRATTIRMRRLPIYVPEH
ncbi:MAG: hypothetical protein AAB074_11665 [Planctomycetota bacterium]